MSLADLLVPGEGKDPFLSQRDREDADRFGMALLLLTLAVLFISLAIGAVVIRLQLTDRGQWPTDLPRLPLGMVFSSVVLIVSSVTMHGALGAVRRGDSEKAASRILATFILGAAFLAIQIAGWWTWLDALGARWDQSQAYRFALAGYYVLTGLHAMHVLGGLLALGIASYRATHGGYTATDHRGLIACGSYWHFLLIVWLGVYAVLLLVGP